MISGKERERELATFDENQRAQWECLTLWATKNKSTYRGGEGTSPVTTACPEKITEGTKPPTS